MRTVDYLQHALAAMGRAAQIVDEPSGVPLARELIERAGLDVGALHDAAEDNSAIVFQSFGDHPLIQRMLRLQRALVALREQMDRPSAQGSLADALATCRP